MLNNYTLLVGFLKQEPALKENDKKEKVCLFTLITQDKGENKEITCMATGNNCDLLLVWGLKGTFWAVGGILTNRLNNSSKQKFTCLKVLEIELLERPKLPGITVEEFVGKYSPKEIVKRAKEKKDATKERS